MNASPARVVRFWLLTLLPVALSLLIMLVLDSRVRVPQEALPLAPRLLLGAALPLLYLALLYSYRLFRWQRHNEPLPGPAWAVALIGLLSLPLTWGAGSLVPIHLNNFLRGAAEPRVALATPHWETVQEVEQISARFYLTRLSQHRRQSLLLFNQPGDASPMALRLYGTRDMRHAFPRVICFTQYTGLFGARWTDRFHDCSADAQPDRLATLPTPDFVPAGDILQQLPAAAFILRPMAGATPEVALRQRNHFPTISALEGWRRGVSISPTLLGDHLTVLHQHRDSALYLGEKILIRVAGGQTAVRVFDEAAFARFGWWVPADGQSLVLCRNPYITVCETWQF